MYHGLLLISKGKCRIVGNVLLIVMRTRPDASGNDVNRAEVT
jgi:hypothetical protein